jgi:ABC-type antimicrobial peptide transport system permease subunit
VQDKPTNQLTGVPLSSTRISIGTGAARRSMDVAVARDAVHALGPDGGYYITADKARSLGLPIVDAGVLIRNPRPLDESQSASIDVLSQSQFVGGGAGTFTDIAWTGTSSNRISEKTIEQIVLGVAVLIALIVLAMSLALSAAETRDERDVLLSLGARPSTMRAVSAYKAALLSAAGALVAIPTGFVPVAVVFVAITRSDQVAHVGFPWWTMVELVVLAPLLAAGVAFLGSAIAQAARPTRMSTFATD